MQKPSDQAVPYSPFHDSEDPAFHSMPIGRIGPNPAIQNPYQRPPNMLPPPMGPHYGYYNANFPPLPHHQAPMNQPYFHPNGMMPPPPNSNLPAPQYHAVAMPPMGQAQTQGKLSFALQNSKTARKNKNTANFLPTAVPSSQINRTGPPPPMTLGNWMTPPTSVSHQPPSQANINESFPPALLKFTTDAFTSCKTEEDKKYVEGYIGQLISDHSKNGTIWSTPWEKKKFPALPSDKGQKNNLQNLKTPTKLGKRKNQNNGGIIGAVGVGNDDLENYNDPFLTQQRSKRFKNELNGNSNDFPSSFSFQNQNTLKSPKESKKNAPIVGTCSSLEKSYYRLIGEIDISSIRPERILKQSVILLKNKWMKKEVDYIYICDQFKAIRQDLTVQTIKNDFTVEVYETHAKLALENNDLSEFNQCQTQLKLLYEEGFAGHQMEFLAYRILYLLNPTVKKGMEQVLYTIQELSDEQKQHEYVKHALQVQCALALQNYFLFFKLYLASPNMGAILLDKFIDSVRLSSLRIMFKSYRPSIPVSFVSKQLAFRNEHACLLFLKQYDIKFLENTNQLGWHIDAVKSTIRAS